LPHRGGLFCTSQETFDLILGGDLREKAEQMFAAAHDGTPTAPPTNFYEAPLIYAPKAMESDYADLVFETHNAVLLLLQDALEKVEANKT
jgi:hypothetical protein